MRDSIRSDRKNRGSFPPYLLPWNFLCTSFRCALVTWV
jgi:hypothetical protein